MSQEPLHNCPECGRKNFTSKGLKAHVCKPAKLDAQLEGYAADALSQTPTKKTKSTGDTPVLHVASEDALMGEQLTTQYRRATSGMQEVVIFGAMMMQLREKHPEAVGAGRPKKLSTRGQLNDKNTPFTLATWLKKYAPEVKRTTALRFLHVTEAISESYKEIVGAKIAKLISLPDLVTTPPAELPQGCEAKQLRLFDFVNGTSQRSWLDMFSPESPQKRGHKTKQEQGNDKLKPKTAAELTASAEAEMSTIVMLLSAWFQAGHQNRVSEETRETAEAVLEDARKRIKGVRA